MMYAINLTAMMNLTKSPAGLPLLMLLRGIVTETVVQPLSGIGHEALLVKDEVTAERWRAITAVVRQKLAYQEFPLYEKGKNGWKTIR